MTTTTDSRQITIPELARRRGCDESWLRKLIKRGLPATRRGARWFVDPDDAERWLEQNAPRIGIRLPVSTSPKSPPRASSSKKGPAPPTGNAASSADLEQRIDALVRSMLDSLGDRFDPRLIAGFKQACSELRLLARHRFEMQKLEGELVPRDEYLRVVDGLARIVVDEITAEAPIRAQAILVAVQDTDDARGALRAAILSSERQAEQLRTRIADAIVDSDL